MASLHNTQCCGLKELTGLSKYPERTLMVFCRQWFNGGNGINGAVGALVQFSDAVRYTNGELLKNFIEKNGFGDVVCPKAKLNPNSQNEIVTYIWRVDDKKLYAWYTEKHKELQAIRDQFPKGTKVTCTSKSPYKDNGFEGIATVNGFTTSGDFEVIWLKLPGGADWYFKLEDYKKLEVVKD